MSPFRLLEILVCSLVTFGPLVAVTIYPFRKNLRFGPAVTAILAAVSIIAQVLGDLVICAGLIETAAIVKLPLLVLHVAVLAVAVRANFGKKVFILLSTLTLSLMVNIGSGLLELRIFPDLAESVYNWTDIITTFVMEALLLIPYSLLSTRKLTYAMVKPNRAFGWLWILSLLVIAVWVAVGITTESDLISLLAMFAAFWVVMIITSAVAGRKSKAAPQKAPAAPQQKAPQKEAPAQPAREEQPAAPARKAAHTKAAPAPAQEESGLELQVMQRNNLIERVAEAEQFHQELHRHIEAMAYRLDRRQYDKLANHVYALQSQLSEEMQTVYCKNQELNSLVTYFIRMAGYCGARVYTNMHVNQEPDIPTTDLSIMLGSLLDYALDSCKSLSSYDRRIYASLRNNGKAMYLNVEFTCDSPVQVTGVGMNTCSELVSRHNGTLETSHINGIFKATAIFHPDGTQTATTAQIPGMLHANLMARIAESDQFHRELLRHVEAMAYRLEHKQYDKLHMHVSSLLAQLQAEDRTTHCDNKELNSLVSYFNRMAGYCGTRVFTNIHVAADPVIPAKNLTVMLGNLMDNALAACKNQPDADRRIYASLRNNGAAMYLNVEYTCGSAPQPDEQGLKVCRQIADLYDGHLETSCINGIFKTTAILRP